MDVVVHRFGRGFLGCLEQWSDIDVETDIGEARGHDLLAAIVPILSQLGDQDPRTPPSDWTKASTLARTCLMTSIVSPTCLA